MLYVVFSAMEHTIYYQASGANSLFAPELKNKKHLQKEKR